MNCKLSLTADDRHILDTLLQRVAAYNKIQDIRYIKISNERIVAEASKDDLVKTALSETLTGDQYVIGCISHPVAVRANIDENIIPLMGKPTLFPSGTIEADIIFDDAQLLQQGINEMYSSYKELEGKFANSLPELFQDLYPVDSYELFDLIFNDWAPNEHSANKIPVDENGPDLSNVKLANYADLNGMIIYTVAQTAENAITVIVSINADDQLDAFTE